jgi:hypothetical protein
MDRPQSIYVYELIPVSELSELPEKLAQLVFGMSSVDDGSRHLAMAPLSGYLTYVDDDALWQGSVAGQENPEPAARAFVDKAADALRRERLPAVLPRRLRATVSTPVLDPARGEPAHWLVRLQAFLPTGSLTPGHEAAEEPADAPVDGGTVDLRIGAGGAVIGLVSRWRPWARRRIVARLPPPESAVHEHGGDAPQAELAYALDGEDEPQTYLAPYYVTFTDHGRVIAPASGYSPVVHIVEEPIAEGTRLTAEVEGTLGPLHYAWGAARLDRSDEGAFEQLGSGRSVSLRPGVYDIVLDVQDQRTGAICRRGAIVYVVPRRPER